MIPTLIFITGAPGVGKTTVARHLFMRLSDSAWLDGDDVWRLNPFRVGATATALAERNIVSVLRNYLEAGCSHVILSWVLHKQEVIDRILSGLKGIDHRDFVFTLVCEETVLLERLRQAPLRNTDPKLAIARLTESRALDTAKIDTTGKGVEAIVDEIAQCVLADQTTENS